MEAAAARLREMRQRLRPRLRDELQDCLYLSTFPEAYAYRHLPQPLGTVGPLGTCASARTLASSQHEEKRTAAVRGLLTFFQPFSSAAKKYSVPRR